MKQKTIGIIVVVIGICAIVLYFQNRLLAHLFFWQVRIDTIGFTKAKVARGAFQSTAVDSIEAWNGNSTLIIIRTKPDDSDKFMKDKQFLLTSLFESATSPYPEAITNNISCPEELKPKRLSVKEGFAYRLYAGERLNYGVCAKDLIKHKSAYGIFNCRDKGVFELKVFSSDQNFSEHIIRSFSCNAKL